MTLAEDTTFRSRTPTRRRSYRCRGAHGACGRRLSSEVECPDPVPGLLLDRGRYTAFEVAGAVTLTFPIGINDRGQIVGYYDDADGLHGFLRHKDGSSAQSTSRAPAQPRP